MADPSSAASSFFAAPSSPSRTTSPTIGGNAGGNFFASNFFASSAAGDFLNSLGVNSASSPFFPPNSQAGTSSQMLARNSTKTLKCPKCNWHYKYQETLEIHMKEKHADQEVVCMFCVENQAHPKLARGETYSCGYKPYRCELCKYSTTTKGNLSIHMQSDKHLHALQEIPQSLAAAAAGHSQILLGQFGAQTSPNPFVDPTSAGLPAQFNSNGGGSLQCLICLSFSTDRLDEMLAHLDRDRGQPQEGDIAALHGYFQCLLCPYSTNLKANFQLHTRTDKHLQRVQLINHLREASALLGPAEQFARLGSLKSAIQVRCQPCQEIFSCAPSLGDHCHSAPHLQKMTIGGGGAAAFFFAPSMLDKTTMPLDLDENAAAALLLEHFLRNAHFCCGKCQQQWSMPASLIDVAIEHSTSGVHNNGDGDGGNGKGGGGGCGGEEEAAGKEGNENSSSRKESTEAAAERAIGWQEMEEFLIGAGQAQKMMMGTPLQMRGAKGQKGKEEKEEGKKAPSSSSKNADDQAQNTAKAKCCPLCSTNEPQPDLPRHIAEQHNIPQEIAQRLAQQTEPTATLSAPSLAKIKSEPTSDSSPMAAEPSVSSSSIAKLLATTTAHRPSPSHSAPSPQSSPPPPQSSSAEDATANNPIFAHRCPECPLAFRTAPQLKAHSLSHSGAQFRLVHRCSDEESQCAEEFATRAELDLHAAKKHAADGKLSASEPGGHFCDICQDGQKFDSDQALLAHFNSETHLRRAGRAQQQQSMTASTSSANPSPSSSNSKAPGASNRRSNSANPTKSLPYICNVCSQAFGQPGTLDTHLRSMAHSQRMAKLTELIQSGDVDPGKPVFEQPEPHPPQRSIAEAAKERKKQMGKLSMATAPQTQQQQQQAQSMHQQSSAASNSNALLDNMFKPDQQQQQQMMLQMMAQMFGGTMAQQQQQEEMMANQQQAFQMAQMAQMMLTAQMAAAQMAAAAAAAQANNNNNNNANNANNGFGGLFEMFTKQQNGHHQQQQAEEMNNNNNNGAEIGEPPKAKRPRPNDVTPPPISQQQLLNQWANSNGEGSERASREGSTAPSNHPAAGLDLASVLQALASGTMPQMPPSSSSSSSMPFPFGGGGSTPPSAAVPDPSNLLMAMAAAQQQQFPPSTASTSANSSASLAPSGPPPQSAPVSHSNAPSPSPQKRARTRIGDDHIKILRQYFDINNSPSEEQIKEMAQRTNLAEKVIKHWFRNTLFKERQRDKDSPYNFSIPPQMGIDLATYHRTGEARIVPLVKQENKEEDTDRKEEYEEKKGEDIKNEVNENDGSEMPEGMGKGKREDSDENKVHSNGQMEEEGKNENENIQRQESDENENEEKKPESNEGAERGEEEEEEELGEEELLEEGDEDVEAERSRSNAENMAAVAADLLASIGRQHQQSQSASAMASGLPFGNVAGGGGGGFNPAEQFAQMFSSAAALSSTFPSNPFGAAAFNPFNAIGAACGAAPSLPFNPFGPVPVSLPSGPSAASAATLPSAHSAQPQQCLQSNSVPTTSSSNNPGQNQIQPANANGNSQSNAGSGSMGSGRRANRTRFTDFQLRTLQDFFDKQAYPKDDDLEMLSKKMGLSPRVIVVWFQNARQKARKVFEQQPHLMAQHHSMAAAVTAAAASAEHQQMDPRFARTPSSNFQCRVCGQIFQRYLELIQHQQRVCLAGVEQPTEPEKQQQQTAETLISGFLNGKLTAAENGGGMDGEEGKGENGKQQQQTPSSFESAQEMLFRQLMAPLQQQQEQMMKSERPNSTEENPAPPKNNVAAFHKRCPFCGLFFHSRNKMTQHFAQRHPEQQQLDADSLPQADEQIVPAAIGMDLLLQSMMGAAAAGASVETTAMGGAGGPLDLSLNAAGGRQNGNGTPFEPKDEGGGFRSNEASLSPAAFSSAGENDFANESQACSPLAALLPALFQPLSSTQRPPNMGSPLNGASGGSNSSKRFRTHLTPMQVFIMKSLFHDYKTPSMQECDALGQKIGLHKRVVQVWFQNARAKERKTNSGSGSAEPEEAVPNCGSSQHCQLCDVPLPNGQSIQEHVFSLEHIEQIKERGALLRGINGEGGDELRKEGGGEGGSTTPGGTNPPNGGDATAAAAALSQQFGPLAQLPYFALAAAGLGQSATANGGGIPPLLYDPALFGTPVPALKIPETVAQQILIDMTQRKECSNFTQDGLELADLEMKLAAEDFQQAGTVDLEVGWGCIQCGNVFQQAELLQNHQKLICPGAADSSSGGTFRLVQTHYQCQCCPQQQKFGTQDDFCAHCHSEEHKSARRATIR